MADHDHATSSSYFIYDVFLSFRGDTRHAFTDHLYRALIQKRINTFRDDPDLRLGDEIRPTLLEAIEKSRMSIVVLCGNYASSTWCLDELVKIMECKDKGRPVLPVFYHVEPREVRYQQNQYETAMIEHENRCGRDSPKVVAWKSALFTISNLSGVSCNKDRYESEIINKIVEDVFKKYPHEPLHIKHSLRFNPQFEEVKSLLDLESHDTRCMVGIYGDDEIEKTAFVVELYNKIRHQFEATSFLANVSEKSKERINGLEDLQKTLLSEMGEEAKTKMGSTFKGSSEIKRRLGHKRVLLVLDDVDSVQQLDSLAGGGDWFGLGSRIIVATKDEDVLDNHVLDGVEIKRYCIDEGEFEGNKRQRDVEEEDVVGLMSNFHAVVNQLKEKDSSRNVVSITGMGGLGKTTLARKIYNNHEVKELFPCRAWSCVSKDYKVRKVLVSLLNHLMPSTSQYENLSEEDLKNEGRKCLKRKNYLVVLDDVWEPEVWDKIKDFFPNNKNGSMILITTRNQRVANYTRSKDPHQQLPFLDAEESWELFCKKVFYGEECPPYLEPIGRSIVKSCQGLPLAIITLAGLVAKRKRTQIEWSQIESLVPYWYIAEDEDSTKVMKILKFSYDDLPEKLKRCFLYFGTYPEDYDIRVKELIQLWIAEGFIQLKKTGRSKVPQLEDIGEEYLKDLVDRNLVQVARRRSDGEGVKTCRIHDLLRELCISESSNANNFLEVYTESNSNTMTDPRRLSFLCDAWSYISSITCDQSCTHSLFFFGRDPWLGDIFRNFQSVNVLHFTNSVSDARALTYLNRLIHLRYLRMQCSYLIHDFPDCIWSLQNLETLDIGGGFMMPIGRIWKLKRLRHLHIRWSVRLLADKQGANDKTMQNLQTLCYVLADAQLGFLLNNGCLPNVRKLGLTFEEDRSYSVAEQLRSLHCLSNLRALKLQFLRRITYGSLCSVLSLDAIAFPSNLTKITLKLFDDLDSKNMNALGRITNLRILKFEHGGEWYLHFGAAGNFPQLQVLHMRYMSVSSVILEEGALPRLRRVVIRGCRSLVRVPERLLSLGNLRKVYDIGFDRNHWETAPNI